VHRLIPPEPERRTAPVVPPTGAVAMDRDACRPSVSALLHRREALSHRPQIRAGA
jgi:hypothetical protein